MATFEGPDFQELQPQDVREYWEHEAHEFTPWLADQVRAEDASHLEDVLGLDLEVIETEKSVGKYSVDILAEVVEDGRRVVIENQLNPSDHDHLGKCIAYAAGIDADIIVWLSPQFNDEHKDAFNWLNKNSREGIDLFAIRLEVWKIGESPPAVRLNPVEDPSEWKAKAKRSESEISDTRKLQEEYWTQFRDLITERDTPLRARKPKPQHWYNNPIGRSGFNLQFTVNTVENNLYCQLIIKDDSEAYQALEEQRDEIEVEMADEIIWSPPEEAQRDSNRAKITLRRPGTLSRQEEWDEYHEWMIDRGERFHDVFYDRIQQL
ncbi:DUF4268 domain-containing protein [Halorubrum sp. AD140]|uniref:DUF4268 domain-containing protein n=1 Tax=Halorubrum sp. AD140 TaxID=3050073 RepID=UPI002ACC6E06|nr:DUF4268 domain-containing protein [Halorubrum sp. AD140]MDZ5810363.1 DUF4268 domain-containing protein [Halorubrum sp. AD140]